MKALEVAKVSNLSPDDYILYEISKRKKYEMTLVEEEAESRGLERGIKKGMERGMEKGKIETFVRTVLTAHLNGFNAQQIGDFMNITLEKVLTILDFYNPNEDYEKNVENIVKKIMLNNDTVND